MTDIEPGFYTGISNEAYHAGPGVSKSMLWTLHKSTPAHLRYGEKKETKALDMGSAIDLAILEPHEFEAKVIRGPADRRGNKWKDCEAANPGCLVLPERDHDTVLQVRDSVLANSFVRGIVDSPKAIRQGSGYAIDEETRLIVRCRPDLLRPDLGIMLDLKSARDASPAGFGKAVAEYGYHVQEAWYPPILRAAGQQIEGTVFLVVEKEPPYAHAVYELKPSAVAEGHAIARNALAVYAECLRSGEWPGYVSDRVVEIDIPRWAYRLTQPARDDEPTDDA
jgi:hypothetical protein